MEQILPKPEPVSLYDSLVTVLVGCEQRRFDIHKGLLCQSSDFFRAALNGNFQESDGTIKLPEQEPALFNYFVYCLYTGKLRGYHYPKTIKPSIDDLRNDLCLEISSHDEESQFDLPLENPQRVAYSLANYYDVPISTLVRLYILADVLQVRNLKDPIINVLIENYYFVYEDHDVTPLKREGCICLFWSEAAKEMGLESPAVGVNLAWANLPHDSGICRLTVFLFCNQVQFVRRTFTQEVLNSYFMLAVAELYAHRWLHGKSTMEWNAKEVCGLHEHEKAGDCPYLPLDMELQVAR